MKINKVNSNRLIISLISNIIAFSVSLIISFVLTPYLISSVGKEVYSFYPISNNFVSYMTIVTMALNSMAARFITIEFTKGEIEEANRYYSSVFFSNIILCILLTIPMITIVYSLDKFMNVPLKYIRDVKIMFSLVFLSMLINVVTSVFGICTFTKNRMDLNAGKDIFQGLVKAALFIILFIIFKPSIIYFGIVAVILSITNFIIQLIMTKKITPEFRISLNDIEWLKIKELLKSGIWNAINSLGSILLISIALLMSNTLIGANASGDLSIVQTLPNLMTTIIYAIYAVFLPRITQVYATNNLKNLINEVRNSQKILGLISTIPALLVIIFGQDFFNLWVPSENAVYLNLLSIITIIPLIVHANMWTIYGLNVVQNKMKIPSIVLIGMGLINIICTYLFIKNTNIGLIVIPTLSAGISIIYYLIFIPIYTSKKLKISLLTFYPHLVSTGIFSLIVIPVGVMCKRYIQVNTWFEFFFWGGVFGVIGLGIYIVFIGVTSKIEKKLSKKLYKFY